MNWYQVKEIDQIDSPALLVFPERIQHNIETMIEQVEGNVKRLFPHVKTHKMAEVVQMQMDKGIERFKCATISEMEMVLETGVKFALIAYQMVGPKIERLVKLAQQYPTAQIASLVDNVISTQKLAAIFANEGLVANVYIDVDNGMHRTGCSLDENTFALIKTIHKIENLNLIGLHVYDGQFRMKDVLERQSRGAEAFQPIYDLLDHVNADLGISLEVINGGSPSFSAAAMRSEVYCSPGTVLLWDAGYSEIVPEINAQCAAVLMTRIISKPHKGIITVDLGHKSVGSENPITNRLQFLNLQDYEAYKHSEEHLMIKVKNWESLEVGDVLYAIPFHVCPSVALHQEAYVIEQNKWIDTWEIKARNRRIRI